MPWFPCHSHSMYSTLDGLSHPEKFAHRLVQCGHSGSALTDHNNAGGALSFKKALEVACKHCGNPPHSHEGGGKEGGPCLIPGVTCKGYTKAKLKAVLGCEFYLCKKDAADREANNSLAHLCVLSKNRAGWDGLIKALSHSNKPEHFYYKPRLSLEQLAAFAGGNWVAFSGHPGSQLADCLFVDRKKVYAASTAQEVRGLLVDDWEENACHLALHYQDLFGRENFFLEIQLIDRDNLPAAQVIAQCLRKVAQRMGIPRLATADSHYPAQEDAIDQRVLLCNAMKTTMGEVGARMDAGDDVGLAAFFRSNNYHIPTLPEMEDIHEKEEISSSLLIQEMCEDYDLTNQPRLPRFETPDGLSQEAYLNRLCNEGMVKRWLTENAYHDRLAREMGVICENGLAPYFLIVRDFVDWARRRMLVGRGRGSACGCLISYATGITDVDPVEYDLFFERFFNAGRVTPGKISLPDIDVDFPSNRRDEVITYLQGKYGEKRVAQLATFGRMQGRGALKDVLRAWGAADNAEMNRITKAIPQESQVSDELQEMREDVGEGSIIRLALERHGKLLSKWCVLTDEGEFKGPLARHFAQAIRMEGTVRSQGRHASAIVIGDVPLEEIAPMAWDSKHKQTVVGLDMRDAEAIGLVKMDILGVAALDRIAGAVQYLRTGKTDQRLGAR